MKEFTDKTELVDHLVNLLKEQRDAEKPFPCPNLVVLPEDMSVKLEDDIFVLKKGALICHLRAYTFHTDCELGTPQLNSDGTVEFGCKYHSHRIAFKFEHYIS
jgi:hypothetical protein